MRPGRPSRVGGSDCGALPRKVRQNRRWRANPPRIHRFSERFQFFRERSVAQDRLFYLRRKFKEIGEQAIEDADLILEGGIAILGQGRVSRIAGETLTLRGTFEDAQRASAPLGGRVDIHFHARPGLPSRVARRV